jgi:hypothetical protein
MAPAGATKCRLWLRARGNAGGYTHVSVDDVSFSEVTPPRFQYESFSITPAAGPYFVGDTVQATYTVRNIGETPSVLTGGLHARVMPVNISRDFPESSMFSLYPNETRVVSLARVLSNPGTWSGQVYGQILGVWDVEIEGPNPAFSFTAAERPPVVLTPVYRFYNKSNGTHFFTPSVEERDMVLAKWGNIYTLEGPAYHTNPANNTQPLYRFYNKKNGSHFYTASADERDAVIAKWPTVFAYDGETYKVSLTAGPGKLAVYRFYNKKNGSHFFTASAEERDAVISKWSATYLYEGPAFYVGQ